MLLIVKRQFSKEEPGAMRNQGKQEWRGVHSDEPLHLLVLKH
jgi:hypothetical protein